MWYSDEHSDNENLRWCLLRAIEWGAWPIFISQPIAPLALLVLPWWFVIFVVSAANVFWSVFIRYRLVIPVLAYWGAIFVRLKWITCPLAAIFLWRMGMKGTATLALFWPLAILLMPYGKGQIGVMQKMFMRRLGYEPRDQSASIEI